MENSPIIVESTIDAPVEKIWKALTDKAQMKEWYFDLSDFKAQPGFEFSFPGQGMKGDQYLHKCKVTDAVPMKRLQYSWRYEGYPGNSLVTFEFTPVGEKTKVRLTHEGVETFPKDNSDFAKANFITGWNEIIPKMLPEYLAKHK